MRWNRDRAYFARLKQQERIEKYAPSVPFHATHKLGHSSGDPDNWNTNHTCNGNPAIERHLYVPVGKAGKRACLHVWISFGSTRLHARGQTEFPSRDWYVDLEVSPIVARKGSGLGRLTWPRHRQMVAHVERGLKTCEQAQDYCAWLKSCIDVAGVEGLRALNARSRGRFA